MPENNDDNDIKVNDKRRFKMGEDGKVQDSDRGQEEPEKEDTGAEDDLPGSRSDGLVGDTGIKIGFMDLINSLAGTALIQLGAVADPQTNVIKKDLNAAKQTIDIIELLKEKTAGNLTNDEGMMLDNVLFDLRMRYVMMQEGKK